MAHTATRKESAIDTLEKPFSKMGAKIVVNRDARLTNVNILNGRFVVNLVEGADAEVVNVDAKGRHLLLHMDDGDRKSKFLCGHDERHWFVAAVPESAAATTVRDAKIALMPPVVQQASKGTRRKNRMKRRNDTYVRQGEWFFIPAPDFNPDDHPGVIFEHNGPISRGRGNPHTVETLARFGGITEYEVRGSLGGERRMLSKQQWENLSQSERRTLSVRTLTRGATVFARGAVRHRDHATIVLPFWHRIEMNTEQKAFAMRQVAFYD